MSFCLLTSLILVSAALLSWGLGGRCRIYEFPFLAGAVFAGFVVPQALGLAGDWSLPHGAYEKTLGMSLLCAVMCYLGYVISDRPARWTSGRFDDRRLMMAGVVLSGFGAWFYFLISRLPPEMLEKMHGQWTGLPVAYKFFGDAMIYGFAIAMLLYFRHGWRTALAVVIFDGMFLFDRIVIAARRGLTIEVALIGLTTYWFARRRALPRPAMLLLLTAGSLALINTGKYRHVMRQHADTAAWNLPWEQVAEIDLTDNFADAAATVQPELQNAAYTIAATDALGAFNLGKNYWNGLVFRYVPGQLVGHEVKQKLLFDLPDVQIQVYGYRPRVGSTVTGMADSFEAFGYFGCLVFFVMAWILRRLFESAHAGHTAAQLLYGLVITDALHSVTHHTQWFFLAWIHMGLFLLPAFWWARLTGPGFATAPHGWKAARQSNDQELQIAN